MVKIETVYTSTPGGYSDKHGQWNEANIGLPLARLSAAIPGAGDTGPDGEAMSVLSRIRFQDGPIAEHGVNGVQIDDVLEVLLARMRMLNQGQFACRENSLAITDLESAQNWMRRRTANREKQKVEGQDKPHKST